MTRLQAERRRRGLTQTELAFHAGPLTASEISRFETGMARPYPAQAARLAGVLNVAAEDLLQNVEAEAETRGSGRGVRRQ